MSLNAAIPYLMPGIVSLPVLADGILRLLVENDERSYSRAQLAHIFKVPESDIEQQIQEINEVKARWIYEIKYVDQPGKYYIIGNCKLHIKQHLRRGGFKNIDRGFTSFSGLFTPTLKKKPVYSSTLTITIILSILLAFIYIFTKVL